MRALGIWKWFQYVVDPVCSTYNFLEEHSVYRLTFGYFENIYPWLDPVYHVAKKVLFW